MMYDEHGCQLSSHCRNLDVGHFFVPETHGQHSASDEG
jgi:hypothetical protein